MKVVGWTKGEERGFGDGQTDRQIINKWINGHLWL